MPTIIETTSLQQGTYGVDLKLSFVFPGWDPVVAYNAVSDTWAVAIFKPSGDQLYKTSVTFDDNAVPDIRIPLVAGDLDQAGTYIFQVTKTGASGVNVRSTVSSFVVAASLPEGVVPSTPSVYFNHYFPIYGAQGQLLQSLLRDNAGVLEYNGAPVGGGAAGSTSQIQFNDGGVFGGDPNFTYDKTNDTLTVKPSVANHFGLLIDTTANSGYGMQINADVSGANVPVYSYHNSTFGDWGLWNRGGTMSFEANRYSFNIYPNVSSAIIDPGDTSGVGYLTLTAGAAVKVPLVIKLAASQTANAFEIQPNGSTTPLVKFENLVTAPRLNLSGQYAVDGVLLDENIFRMVTTGYGGSFSITPAAGNVSPYFDTNYQFFAFSKPIVGHGKRVVAKTAAYGIVDGDYTSISSVLTNEGTTARVDFTLPNTPTQKSYTFVVQDTDGIRVIAQTGHTIRIGASVSASGGRIDATAIGSTVTLVGINATQWIAIAMQGTWTVT